jgi:hypothetical protein
MKGLFRGKNQNESGQVNKILRKLELRLSPGTHTEGGRPMSRRVDYDATAQRTERTMKALNLLRRVDVLALALSVDLVELVDGVEDLDRAKASLRGPTLSRRLPAVVAPRPLRPVLLGVGNSRDDLGHSRSREVRRTLVHDAEEFTKRFLAPAASRHALLLTEHLGEGFVGCLRAFS